MNADAIIERLEKLREKRETVWLTPDGMGDGEEANGPTLLDALQSLKERCG